MVHCPYPNQTNLTCLKHETCAWRLVVFFNEPASSKGTNLDVNPPWCEARSGDGQHGSRDCPPLPRPPRLPPQPDGVGRRRRSPGASTAPPPPPLPLPILLLRPLPPTGPSPPMGHSVGRPHLHGLRPRRGIDPRPRGGAARRAGALAGLLGVHHCPKAYGGSDAYSALLSDPSVDVVYVGTVVGS